MYCLPRQTTNICDTNTVCPSLCEHSIAFPFKKKIVITNLSFLPPNIKMKQVKNFSSFLPLWWKPPHPETTGLSISPSQKTVLSNQLLMWRSLKSDNRSIWILVMFDRSFGVKGRSYSITPANLETLLCFLRITMKIRYIGRHLGDYYSPSPYN